MKSQWLIGLALAVVPGALVAGTAVPGTVNYIEGQVTVNGKAMAHVQNGSTTLLPGQLLSVGTGKVEILLTPGTFLRAGSGSQIQMIKSDLADPQVELVHGEAIVEVDYKPKMARLDVSERGVDTQLLKEGLYRFDAEQGTMQVIDGKAGVAENGHSKEIGKGKELLLTSAELKPANFDWKAEDELYRWSSVRDSYLAQASEASARNVYVEGGWGPGMGWGPGGGMGWGTGWYWNPYYATYAWLPGDGYFWSPFGYPFFSPRYIVYAPGIRYGGFPGSAVHVTGTAAVAGRVGAVSAARVSGGGVAAARAGGGGRRR